jgi:hypothetical protein
MNRVTEVDGYLRLAFGTPVLSTSGRAHGRRAPWRIDTYADRPADDAFTIATVGVCDTPLAQELLLSAWNAHKHDGAYNTLFTVSDDLVARELAVEQGMVLELQAPVVAESRMRQLFVYTPVYHLDDTSPIETQSGPVALYWLIPITTAESDFVDANGWEEFDSLLLEHDPDLLDWTRASIV